MNKRVLVAMSGGVDSSVALIKVIEEGFEPIGITMKLWESSDSDGTPSTDSYCCSIEAINNAKNVCKKFGVPHYTLDYKEIFRKNVVDYLVDKYFTGITPNPCIQCNVHIRWGALFDKANDLDANWVATGHYAKIGKMENSGAIIRKGIDDNKDQSYVLWGIDPKLIPRTLFPIGDLTKQEVRIIAEKADLITANIKESQELCFLPNADYRRFLKEYAPNRTALEKDGIIISTEGETLGNHTGISIHNFDCSKKLNKNHVLNLKQLIQDYHFICFKTQNIDENSLVSFTRNFGNLESYPEKDKTKSKNGNIHKIRFLLLNWGFRRI